MIDYKKRPLRWYFLLKKILIQKKYPFSLHFSLGIPYMVLWLNVCNKELLTLRNFLVTTKKFLKAKFDCINFFGLWFKQCAVLSLIARFYKVESGMILTVLYLVVDQSMNSNSQPKSRQALRNVTKLWDHFYRHPNNLPLHESGWNSSNK